MEQRVLIEVPYQSAWTLPHLCLIAQQRTSHQGVTSCLPNEGRTNWTRPQGKKENRPPAALHWNPASVEERISGSPHTGQTLQLGAKGNSGITRALSGSSLNTEHFLKWIGSLFWLNTLDPLHDSEGTGASRCDFGTWLRISILIVCSKCGELPWTCTDPQGSPSLKLFFLTPPITLCEQLIFRSSASLLKVK